MEALRRGADKPVAAIVEDGVRVAAEHFERGPRELSKRGTREDDTHAFVVEDGNYISARWPGDAYLIAKRFLANLGSKVDATTISTRG